ncbi:MAG: hypothetical protein AMXMBFR36_12140 [Acidobacteriota bacterium]
MISARHVLGLGVLLVAVGLGSIVYFDHAYDTWVRMDVAPLPDSVYAGDMTEGVFYQDEASVERARIGRRTGFTLFGAGAVVAASALIALRRSQRATDSRPAP